MTNPIVVKLAEVQQKFNCPKDTFNEFGNYHYRTCEQILQAVKPLLQAGCIITLSDKMIEVGGRIYVQATASFQDMGNEPITVTACAREQLSRKKMDDSQITGSASTYARKYALCGLLLIDDNKDADTQEPINEVDVYQSLTATFDSQIQLVKKCLAEDDYNLAAEAWGTLTEEVQKSLWKPESAGGCFTKKEMLAIKTKAFIDS